MPQQARSLSAALSTAAEAPTAADAPALTTAETGETLDYRRLVERVDELARRLRGAGLERDDRVAIVLPNGPEFVELLLAVTTVGAAAAPLNPAYTAEEHRFYLADIAPKLLVLAEGETPAAREALSGDSVLVELTPGRDRLELSASGRRLSATLPFEPAEPDDVALLLHTSGTTSRPKQVPLLHRNLVASASTVAECYQLTPADVSFCVMPLFHVHGLVASTLAPLVSGGSVLVARRLSPRRFWAQLADYGVTWLSAGPTLHHMLLDRGQGSAALPSLRFARSCSSALSAELFERCESSYGVPMLEAYGMTEASHQMTSNPPPPGDRFIGSVGVATGTEIAIADAHGAFLPAGAVGEVCIRGPGVTPGYLGNEEANETSFFDGWFRTGDQGVLDGSGYLRLTGRIKELILRGGENISPLEIEATLLDHPAVGDAVAFGIPDAKYGEEVAAAVSLTASASEAELVDFCRERLAAFKVPRAVHILAAIPRTPTGKVQRRRVAEAVSEG